MTETSTTPPIADRLLDVCGLKCPMPILRTKKALAAMASGEVLEILVTDPAAREDFAAFARQTGHVLLHVQDGDAQWAIYLRCK
ncbi:MAG: hypothetical protein B7C55_12685 [Actinomycetales bacterium mxb001]|nr:MAG: hypothetical protein B7C55_12685 [Actinomycetales bacterium mxb001]